VDAVFFDFSKARKYGWRAALVTVTMRRPGFLALGEREQKQEMNDHPGPWEQKDAPKGIEVVGQYPCAVALSWFGKALVAGGRFLGNYGQMLPIQFSDSVSASTFKKKRESLQIPITCFFT